MQNTRLHSLRLAGALLACGLFAEPLSMFSQAAPSPERSGANGAADENTASGLPQVVIELGKTTNASIRPLLGVNAGPLPAGRDPANADLTLAYRRSGVTMVRTHDFYGPLDMATMYPDRTGDPHDRDSYAFAQSDAVWKRIVDGGFEPYFRIGDSFNNVRPPASRQERNNWAQAAVEVVRHYREGKWDGFKTPFRYVEIWNEPDNQHFWPRPRVFQEFMELYMETAMRLKKAFPDLQVGGPAITHASSILPRGQRWTRDFLASVRKSGAPLDFLSWHIYSNDPEEWANTAQFFRSKLDAEGFRSVPMHVTEWNTDTRRFDMEDTSGAEDASAGKFQEPGARKIPIGPRGAPARRGIRPKEESLALRTGGKGAAILTAAWIAMQENGVDLATFYRGPDPAMDAPEFYGMFYANGEPKKTAQAFSLWAQMAAHPRTVRASVVPRTGLWCLAGQDEAGERALLVANPTETPVLYRVLGLGQADVGLLEVSDRSKEIRSLTPPPDGVEIGEYTVQLLTARGR